MRRFAIVALLVATAASAFAQHRWSQRRLGVHWENGAPNVSFSVRDLMTQQVETQLATGVAQRMNVTIQAFRTGTNRPIVERQVRCTVTLDLWARNYEVRRGRRTWRERDLDAVVERCLVLRGVRVGNAREFRRHRGLPIIFAVRAEINPIEPRRCRELLRQSNQDIDFGGSVVISLYRREICAAELFKQFRSQDVVVPGAPP